MQALFALLLATNLCLAAPPEQQYSAQLLNPTMANATAPNVYKVKFKTTKGPFVVKVYRQWAPLGADRLYNLVQAGFYNEGIAFFRNINGFMVQFGIHGDPDIGDIWRGERIKDDPVVKSNTRKMVTFAMAGPNTRTTQVFINFADKNQMLDGQGFAPLGKVTGGMKVVDSLYNGYGEGVPRGNGPNQGLMQSQGNAYLQAEFPELDYIKSATIK